MTSHLPNRRGGRTLRRATAALLAGLLFGLAPVGTSRAQEARDTSQACGYVSESGFDDRPEDEAFAGPIDCIAWYGVARGITATTYGVSRTVTRGQMATFLVNTVLVAGVDVPDDPPNRFTDDDGHTHEVNINRAAALGIASGVSQTLFQPNNNVRRDQMATFVAQAIEAITGEALAEPEENHFGDDDGNTHERRINQLADLGIVTGTGTSAYSPAASVTRRQMALFLARDLAHLTDVEAVPLGRLAPPAAALQSPELIDVEVVSQSGGNVALRFVFDESVNSSNIDFAAFHYYTAGAARVTATRAAIDSANPAAVQASFDGANFSEATVAGVDHNAVQSPPPEALPNPEGNEPIDRATLTAGRTSGADLVTVTVTGSNTARFTFDEAANAAEAGLPPAATSAGYGVVLPSGQAVMGNDAAPGGNGTAVHTVTFGESVTGAVRGFVLSGAVEAADDDTPTPQQAVPIAAEGLTSTPDLIAVRPLPGSNTVEYEFDSGVTLPSSNPISPAGSFRIYKVDGTEVEASSRALKSGSNAVVVATFAAGEVDDTVVGGSVDEGAVQSSQNQAANAVDARPVEAVFESGDTAAPDLLAAGKTDPVEASFPPSTMNRSIVFVFDQPVAAVTGSRFVVYAPSGARTVLTSSTSNAGCTASGFKVTCTANSSTAGSIFTAMENAVVAAVEHAAVQDAGERFDSPVASAVML